MLKSSDNLNNGIAFGPPLWHGSLYVCISSVPPGGDKPVSNTNTKNFHVAINRKHIGDTSKEKTDSFSEWVDLYGGKGVGGRVECGEW